MSCSGVGTVSFINPGYGAIRTTPNRIRFATDTRGAKTVDVTTPDLTLPAHMLPADGRFGSGPSKVDPGALQALAATGSTLMGTSHRQKTVRNLVGSVRAGFADLFSLPEGYEVLLGNGGATLFWDAATFGLIGKRSQHLVFGEFSSKFAAAASAAPHLDEPEVISADTGSAPRCVASPSVDAYCYPHNETSTGVMVEVVRPDPSSSALVLVDATSAAGGLPIELSACDVYYFSPQKCFGADAGVWFAAFSPAAIERLQQLRGRWTPASLDLGLALDNSRLDQTYNTPALASMFLVDHTLKWMNNNGGLPFAVSRCEESARRIYEWASASAVASPYVADPALRSRTVATIDFDESVSADALAAGLRANGIVDTESYRKLGRNQLRIALFPRIDPDDISALVACIDELVARLGG